MRRSKRKMAEVKVKKITIRRLPKRTTFVVQYADGHRQETPYVEIQGNAMLSIDPRTKEPLLSTEADVSLGHNGTCVICGGASSDLHAHA